MTQETKSGVALFLASRHHKFLVPSTSCVPRVTGMPPPNPQGLERALSGFDRTLSGIERPLERPASGLLQLSPASASQYSNYQRSELEQIVLRQTVEALEAAQGETLSALSMPAVQGTYIHILHTVCVYSKHICVCTKHIYPYVYTHVYSCIGDPGLIEGIG